VRTPVDIEDLAPGGEAVGRAGARTVFVPWAAPGDRVEVDVPAGEGPAHGTLARILAAGPARVAPPCPHFGPDGDQCGGCEWLHVADRPQLAAKERAVREALRRIGRLEPGSYELRPILASPAALRYRSRAKFHLDRGAGRLVFFRRRSHVPVHLRECHLLSPGLDALRAAVGPALGAARLAPREVALEWSDHEARGAAWLLLPELTPSVRARAEALLAAVPGLAGAVLAVERGPAPVLLGDPVLRHARVPGRPGAGLQRSRPDVFQQANRGANALLVDIALDLLRPDGEDVLELFCGAGNFTGPLAARSRSVWAVEVQGPALDLARADAAEVRAARPGGGGEPGAAGAAGAGADRRPEVRFFAGDALKLALAFARDPGAPRFRAALLDPPREGAKGIGSALRDLGVARAVYVSCDPATFARDLRACGDADYRVATVQPVDMFPQTHHVEAVALLVRR
jgi:23S rRNA (uracil1939-C5)-methyltransferase